MIVRLERGLERRSREVGRPSADDVLGAVVGRTRASRARRTTMVLAGVLGLALIGGAGAWGVNWWQNRPMADPFGEAAETAQWQEPAKPSKQVVTERCGADFAGDAAAAQWGQMLATAKGYCNLGWEKVGAKEPLSASLWPTTVPAYREACETQTGKSLAGWRLVARGEKVKMPFENGAVQSFTYRSANGYLATCTLRDTNSPGSVIITEERDLSQATDRNGAMKFDETELLASVRGVVGRDGRANVPDHRARRVRVDLGHGVPACELPVTNAHVTGMCRFTVGPGIDLGGDPNATFAPMTLTVLDGRGDVLREIRLGY